MRSLYESILSSTGSGKIGILKNIITKEPTKENLKYLNKLWKDWGLGHRGCHWVISVVAAAREKNCYGYVSSGTKVLIIANYSDALVGKDVNVICKEIGFDGGIIAYEHWIEKLKSVLGAKVIEVEKSPFWNILEF